VRGVIELGTIKVVNGYYEAIDCDKIEEYVEDEKIKKILLDRCKTRGRSIEILKIILLRNKDGDITKIWTIEMFYGPFGVMLFADNP
jgi:hypothetical protein